VQLAQHHLLPGFSTGCYWMGEDGRRWAETGEDAMPWILKLKGPISKLEGV